MQIKPPMYANLVQLEKKIKLAFAGDAWNNF